LNYPHLVFDEQTQEWLVEGTKVPASRIHAAHRNGVVFEVLCKRYPTLSRSKILTALAFGYEREESHGE
jgi:uncharacterized protein (DUF433 family)